jgi:hypothetical protein
MLLKLAFAVCGSLLTLSASGLVHAASGVGPYYAMPAWDQTLPAETRFIVLTNMNSDAVLDRETGLVWERRSSHTITWDEGNDRCRNRVVGGRLGWRLPSLQELQSLGTATGFPVGHPFIALQEGDIYWSGTTRAGNSSEAWVFFAIIARAEPNDKSNLNYVMCVRGGTGPEAQ